jgi:flagellar hook-length control protein FliK
MNASAAEPGTLLIPSAPTGPIEGRGTRATSRNAAHAAIVENEVRARHEQRERRQQAEDRVDAGGAPARSTDVIRADERRLDPASRSFARQQTRAAAGEAAQAARQGFRDALHEVQQPVPAPAEHSPPLAEAPRGRDDSCDSARAEGAPACETGSTHSPPHGAPDASTAAPTAGPTAPARELSAANNLRTFPPSVQAAAQPAGPLPASSAATSAPVAPQPAAPAPTPAQRIEPLTDRQGPRPAAPAGAREPSSAARSTTLARVANALRSAHSAETAQRVEQIVRLVRAGVQGQRAQAVLRLDPPELGAVRIHMELQKDQLSLRIETQTAVARDLLTQEVDVLRQALAGAGIVLDQVEVRAVAATGVPPGDFWQPADPGRGSGNAFSERAAQDDEAEHAPPSHDGIETADHPTAEPRVNVLA